MWNAVCGYGLPNDDAGPLNAVDGGVSGLFVEHADEFFAAEAVRNYWIYRGYAAAVYGKQLFEKGRERFLELVWEGYEQYRETRSRARFAWVGGTLADVKVQGREWGGSASTAGTFVRRLRKPCVVSGEYG